MAQIGIDAEFGNLPVHKEAYYQALYNAAVTAEKTPSVNDPNIMMQLLYEYRVMEAPQNAR
jgi:hypothetical protein